MTPPPVPKSLSWYEERVAELGTLEAQNKALRDVVEAARREAEEGHWLGEKHDQALDALSDDCRGCADSALVQALTRLKGVGV